MKVLLFKHGDLFHCVQSLIHPIAIAHTVTNVPPTELAEVMIELMM